MDHHWLTIMANTNHHIPSFHTPSTSVCFHITHLTNRCFHIIFPHQLPHPYVLTLSSHQLNHIRLSPLGKRTATAAHRPPVGFPPPCWPRLASKAARQCPSVPLLLPGAPWLLVQLVGLISPATNEVVMNASWVARSMGWWVGLLLGSKWWSGDANDSVVTRTHEEEPVQQDAIPTNWR